MPGDGSNGPNPFAGIDSSAPSLFASVAPEAYVNKIKTLLLGAPVTDAEVAAGSTADGLAALVDSWLAMPQTDDLLKEFFTVAF